ncbi:unnamed protein product [Symbiodinium sp. CCMP2592]|nr:unnamed protein product [Symbiodinium sp. CCMP2592]
MFIEVGSAFGDVMLERFGRSAARFAPFIGPMGVLAQTVLDVFIPPPDMASVQYVQQYVGQYVRRQIDDLRIELLEAMDSKLEELRKDLRSEFLEVEELIFNAIDQNSFMETAEKVRSVLQSIESASVGNIVDPDSFLSYLLAVEVDIAHIPNLLFLPCYKNGWPSLECKDRAVAGATPLLAAMVPVHLAVLDGIINTLHSKWQHIRQHITQATDVDPKITAQADALLVENFRGVGCPNGNPSAAALTEFKGVDEATSLSHMYDYCLAAANVGEANCDAAVGPGWKLMRRTPGGRFPQKDQLVGSVNEGDPTGDSFSKAWANEDFDEFLFATGDCAKWMVMSKSEVLSFYSNSHRRIEKSHLQDYPYTARMWRRETILEDPSLRFDDGACSYLYAGWNDPCNPGHSHGGLKVYIRKGQTPIFQATAWPILGFTHESTQVKCEVGNDLDDGYEYMYNADRFGDNPVCGTGAWCCRRPRDVDPKALECCGVNQAPCETTCKTLSSLQFELLDRTRLKQDKTKALYNGLMQKSSYHYVNNLILPETNLAKRRKLFDQSMSLLKPAELLLENKLTYEAAVPTAQKHSLSVKVPFASGYASLVVLRKGGSGLDGVSINGIAHAAKPSSSQTSPESLNFEFSAKTITVEGVHKWADQLQPGSEVLLHVQPTPLPEMLDWGTHPVRHSCVESAKYLECTNPSENSGQGEITVPLLENGRWEVNFYMRLETMAPQESFSDAALTFTMPGTDHWQAIILDSIDGTLYENWYHQEIAETGVDMSPYYGSPGPSAVQAGKWHHYKLIRRGKHLAVLLDEKLLWDCSVYSTEIVSVTIRPWRNTGRIWGLTASYEGVVAFPPLSVHGEDWMCTAINSCPSYRGSVLVGYDLNLHNLVEEPGSGDYGETKTKKFIACSFGPDGSYISSAWSGQGWFLSRPPKYMSGTGGLKVSAVTLPAFTLPDHISFDMLVAPPSQDLWDFGFTPRCPACKKNIYAIRQHPSGGDPWDAPC